MYLHFCNFILGSVTTILHPVESAANEQSVSGISCGSQFFCETKQLLLGVVIDSDPEVQVVGDHTLSGIKAIDVNISGAKTQIG